MASLLYLITVGSVGWAGFFSVLRNKSASLANTFAHVSPVVAVILGWAILSEAITSQIIISAVIIMTGVVLIENKVMVIQIILYYGNMLLYNITDYRTGQ